MLSKHRWGHEGIKVGVADYCQVREKFKQAHLETHFDKKSINAIHCQKQPGKW